MEEINIRDMVRLNHMLSISHYWVKLRKEGDFDVQIMPINKAYDSAKNKKMYEVITDFYAKLGFDVMIDEALMRYNLYKK